MTGPISRQALEVAIEQLHARELTEAARAVLDSEPLEWCVVHRSVKFLGLDRCHLKGRSCRFESYVRVKVEP